MKILTTCMVMAAVTTAAWAAPLGLQDVSSEANWVVHTDLEKLRDTEMGRHVMEKMTTDEANAKFAALESISNFDPRTDLDGVTIYGLGSPKHDGVAIMRGSFDANGLVAMVKKNKAYEALTYQGHTVHSWVKDKKHWRKHGGKRMGKRGDNGKPGLSYGCVHENGALVMSDSLDSVKDALDVLDTRSATLAQSSALPGLQNIDGACMFFAAANTSELKDLNPRAAILRNTDNLSLSVGETDGTMQATLAMETATDEAALNMSKMIDGLIGMAILNAAGNPAASLIAQAAGVTLDGNLLTITLDVAVEDMIGHMQQMCDRKQGR